MHRPDQVFDYVVAGGGAAGCVLAARLAEQSGVNVLLLEAGGSAATPFVSMPAGNGYLFGHPEYDWGFHSIAQPGLGGRSIYFPRGRGLGGSTIMNGMIYIRGNRRDYDGWRAAGLNSWGYTDLLPYFLRAEGAAHRGAPFHGVSGPLRTSLAANFATLDRQFMEAARQAGHPLNEDFNGARQAGVGRLDVMVAGGRRQSSAATYLRRRPDNLSVWTRSRAIGIGFEGKRATALRIHTTQGEITVGIRRELVLCLGAFGSPQLLMVSGVGPAGHLREHDLRIVTDVPGVGAALTDHLNMPVQFECRDPALSFARYQRLDRALWLGARWWLARRGPGAAPFWSSCLFAGGETTEDYPRLQVFFTPMVVKESPRTGAVDDAGLLDRLGRRMLVRGSKRAISGFQLDINLLRPHSRGEVRLASADPREAPRIDPRFLSEPEDVATLIEGLRSVRRIVDQPALAAVRGAELSPGATAQSANELEAAVRELATTGHHPVGTCRMGLATDPGAVVDAELRVIGLEGIRVCDASVFPTQISGNPQATVVACAEKAADLLLGRQPLPAANLDTASCG